MNTACRTTYAVALACPLRHAAQAQLPPADAQVRADSGDPMTGEGLPVLSPIDVVTAGLPR